MNAILKTRAARSVAVVALIAGLTVGAVSCDQLKKGRIGADFDGAFPVVPEDFPLYPRAISVGAASEFYSAFLEGIGETIRKFVKNDVCSDGTDGSSSDGSPDNDNCYGSYVIASDPINEWLRGSVISNNVPSSCFVKDGGQPPNSISHFVACEVKDVVSDLLTNSLDPDMLATFERALEGKLSFFNPAPLGTSLNQQIAGIITSAIEFEKVGIRLTLYNNTDSVMGVPINFSLYIGRYSDVAERSNPILLEEDDVYTAVLMPGEEVTIEIDNIDQLTTDLNDLKSLAIDYDADIDVSLLASALVSDDISAWFNTSQEDEDGDGIVDALAGWSLQVKNFELVVQGNAGLDLPTDVPDFAKDLVDGVNLKAAEYAAKKNQ